MHRGMWAPLVSTASGDGGSTSFLPAKVVKDETCLLLITSPVACVVCITPQGCRRPQGARGGGSELCILKTASSFSTTVHMDPHGERSWPQTRTPENRSIRPSRQTIVLALIIHALFSAGDRPVRSADTIFSGLARFARVSRARLLSQSLPLRRRLLACSPRLGKLNPGDPWGPAMVWNSLQGNGRDSQDGSRGLSQSATLVLAPCNDSAIPRQPLSHSVFQRRQTQEM